MTTHTVESLMALADEFQGLKRPNVRAKQQ